MYDNSGSLSAEPRDPHRVFFFGKYVFFVSIVFVQPFLSYFLLAAQNVVRTTYSTCCDFKRTSPIASSINYGLIVMSIINGMLTALDARSAVATIQ